MSQSASSIKEDMNNKIYARNLPSVMLEQTSSFHLGQENTRYEIRNPCIQQKDIFYPQEQIFHPGSSAPRSGYIQNIDKEMLLRNQIYPLQKGDLQCKIACVKQCNETLHVQNIPPPSNEGQQHLFMNFTRNNIN
jgi:hypothetical protein